MVSTITLVSHLLKVSEMCHYAANFANHGKMGSFCSYGKRDGTDHGSHEPQKSWKSHDWNESQRKRPPVNEDDFTAVPLRTPFFSDML